MKHGKYGGSKGHKSDDGRLGGSGQRRGVSGDGASRARTDVATDTAMVRGKHDKSPMNAGKSHCP